MLEKIDLTKSMSKSEYRALSSALDERLALLQRECRSAGIPIIILFEGLGASGKGTLISSLIEPLDPRGFSVFTIQRPDENERMHPYLWQLKLG